MRSIRLPTAVALTLIALLIHFQYIEYGSATNGHILRLAPAPSDWVDIKQMRRKAVLIEADDATIMEGLDPTSPLPGRATRAGFEAAAAAAYAAAMAVDDDRTPDSLEAETEAKLRDAESDAARSKVRERARELRNIELAKIADSRGYFGMLPTRDLDGTDSRSRDKAFWIGLIVPVVVIFFAILIIRLPMESLRIRKFTVKHGAQVGLQPSPPRNASASFCDSLRASYGEGFPVAAGNATEDDPLVITELHDYVGIEHAAIRHACEGSGQDFRIAKQALLDVRGRKIDLLYVDVKIRDADDWSSQQKFCFDITAGFNALGA